MRRPPGRSPQAGLSWLREALGPAPSGAGPPGAGPSGAAADDLPGYLLVPSASRAQVLLPPGGGGAGWAWFRQHSDAAPRRLRAAKELLAWPARLGCADLLFPGRLAESDVGARSGTFAWTDLAARVFGRRDITMAISVGQIRPQIKPVLHVSTTAGERLGHIKVGWNDVTRGLIRQEAETLAALAGAMADGGALRVPRLLDRGRWRGRDVLAVSDLGGSAWYGRRRTALPQAATRQLGRSLGVEPGVLGSSGFWQERSALARRLAAHPSLAPRMADALARVVEAAESRYADWELDFGLVHGDWAPWNMASTGSSLAVWDWERSWLRGPLGFDGVYFEFQVGVWLEGRTPDQALDRTVHLLPGAMIASGAPVAAGPAVLRLVLLEVALRQLAGAMAGAAVPSRVYHALTGLLERAAAEWPPAAR